MLALLQTCCQIYQEAKTIPYLSNFLHFTDMRDLIDFITDVDFEKVSAIRQIAVGLNWDDVYENNHNFWWKILRMMPNLKFLHIHDKDSSSIDLLSEPYHEINLAIKGLRGLEKLVVVSCDI